MNTKTTRGDSNEKAEARREEVEALAEMRGMDLADEEVMAGAWRTSVSHLSSCSTTTATTT